MTLDERIEAARKLSCYTTGAWEIDTENHGEWGETHTVYANEGCDEIAGYVTTMTNARLIAAAPDLHRLALDLAAERERLLQFIADRCPQCRGTGIKGCSGGTGNAETVLWKCDHGLQWAALAEPRA